MKGRIFSGIQPSGSLHLGNYLGAIRNWVRLQGDYEAIYCVVDLHALTQPHDPKTLGDRTIEVAASYLAAGLDVEKTTIFIQSHVTQHPQLAWIFNCLTPLGWLNRMTQFKDKAGKKKDQALAGLYTYPCADGGRYSPISCHACTGGRGPKAACRTDTRYRRRVQ